MFPVTALFVDLEGPYPQLLGGENCWHEQRDARNWHGPGPVVAHPPCARWCSMAKLNNRRYGTPIGDDGGCFAHALACVLTFGGVLEHPAYSLAWAYYGLQRPIGKAGWNRVSERMWVCEVWQSVYGHVCNKKTWLAYCGDQPPHELNWERVKRTHQVGGGINTGERQKPRANRQQVLHTPVAFAEELIKLARRSRGY